MSNVVTVCMLKFLCCNIGKKYQNLLRTLLRRHWTALTLVLLSFQMCCIGRRMVDECHRLLFHHHNHGGTLEEHSRFHDASSGRTIRCSAQAQYRVKSKVERFEITLDCYWALDRPVGPTGLSDWSDEAFTRSDRRTDRATSDCLSDQSDRPVRTDCSRTAHICQSHQCGLLADYNIAYAAA